MATLAGGALLALAATATPAQAAWGGHGGGHGWHGGGGGWHGGWGGWHGGWHGNWGGWGGWRGGYGLGWYPGWVRGGWYGGWGAPVGYGVAPYPYYAPPAFGYVVRGPRFYHPWGRFAPYRRW
jgi:hypothetical protein